MKRGNAINLILSALFLLGVWFAEQRLFVDMLICFWIMYGIFMNEFSRGQKEYTKSLLAQVGQLREENEQLNKEVRRLKKELSLENCPECGGTTDYCPVCDELTFCQQCESCTNCGDDFKVKLLIDRALPQIGSESGAKKLLDKVVLANRQKQEPKEP